MNALAARVAELGKTVSASRLNCFHQCRLKFYFRYVAAIETPLSPALHVGKVVHAVLQSWNLARWRQIAQTRDDVRQAFEDSWNAPESPVDWKGGEAEQKAVAWNVTGTYLKETPIPADEKPVGVEVTVEAEMIHPGFPKLVGIIDLVRPGGRIVDFKTVGITPQPEKSRHQHELQLTCYALLYREATGEVEGGFELHHLVKLKTPKVVVVEAQPVSQGQLQRLHRSVESYLDGLDRRDFVPSPGLACSSCEFFGQCRKWQGSYEAFEERKAA